jgi:Pentapeptide repeats (8 copies)
MAPSVGRTYHSTTMTLSRIRLLPLGWSALWRATLALRQAIAIIFAVGLGLVFAVGLSWVLFRSCAPIVHEDSTRTRVTNAVSRMCSAAQTSPPWVLLLTVAVAPSVLLTLWWRIRHREEDIGLAMRRERSTRFFEAAQLLASDKLEGRLGALYALRSLVQDSPDEYSRVVETLCAFLRAHGERATPTEPPEGALEVAPFEQPADVKAAFAIVTRLKRPSNDDRTVIDLSGAQLENLDARGAMFKGARLQKANLMGADLQGIDLRGAECQGVNLSYGRLEKANLQGASFDDAILREAQFDEVNMQAAWFIGADLRGACLSRAKAMSSFFMGADLSDADIMGADFTGSDLTKSRFFGATTSGLTKFPEGFSRGNYGLATLGTESTEVLVLTKARGWQLRRGDSVEQQASQKVPLTRPVDRTRWPRDEGELNVDGFTSRSDDSDESPRS